MERVLVGDNPNVDIGSGVTVKGSTAKKINKVLAKAGGKLLHAKSTSKETTLNTAKRKARKK